MRTRIAFCVTAVLIALTACSSNGQDSDGAALTAQSTPSPTASASPTSSAAAGTASTPAATPDGQPTAGPAGPDSPSATQASPAAPVRPLTTTAPGAPAPQKAAAPGTYTFDTSGTVTIGLGQPQDASGTATLTVSPLVAGAQRTSLRTEQGDTEQDLLVRDTGTYAAGLTLTNPAFNKQFRPSPAVLLVPDPGQVGATWSWSMTSTDDKTTAKADNEILRTETLTIGGKQVPCAVIRTDLVLSGDVDYDAVLTTWFALDDRLAVQTHSDGRGSVNGIPFSTDVTSVMRSTTPA